MVLYGEDRITPAKTVALALTELITSKYPKDWLGVIVFGDRAERIDLADIPAIEAGPFHTNTCEALRGGARDAGAPQAPEQAGLPDHRRQALGDHRGRTGLQEPVSAST